MAAEKKSWPRRLHDTVCLGSVFRIRPVQRVCPVCRADLKKAAPK